MGWKKNICRNAMLLLLLLLISSFIFILSLPIAIAAFKNDSLQPIQIKSVKQSLDLEKNITTFTNNVIIKQGNIDIRADKVIVTRPNNDTQKMIVEAYGTPVTFHQLQYKSKPIKGHCNKIRYEMEKKLVILTGNAYLSKLDSNIKGDKITYSINTKQMEAFSNKGKRVTTVLLPSHLKQDTHTNTDTDTGLQ